MCHNHYKTSQRTDYNRIQKYTHRCQKALFTGMFRIGSRRRHGNRTLTGLVGHQPTFHTLCQNCTKYTAKKCFRTKCTGKHCLEKIRNCFQVEQNKNQHHYNIQPCHNRHHFVGPFRNFPDSSKSNDRSQHNYDHTGKIIKDRVGSNGTSRYNLRHSSDRGYHIKSLCRKAA